MTEHEAAKPKRPRDIEFDDAPSQESIRGMSPRTIRRNPSSDQKRVRREMQRKIAGYQKGVDCANSGTGIHTSKVDHQDADGSRGVATCGRCKQTVPVGPKSSDDYHTFYVHLEPGKTLSDRKGSLQETELSRLLVEAAAVDNPFGDWKCATPGCEKYDGMSAFRGDKYCKSCMKAGEPDKQRGKQAARPLPTYPGGGESTPTPKSSEPGDKECQSCGHVGGPTMSDTGPACRNCNSYSLKNVQQARTAAIGFDVPEKKVLPGIGDNGEDMHTGLDWHDVKPGDKVIGLDGAIVKSKTPTNEYGNPVDDGKYTSHHDVTFSHPEHGEWTEHRKGYNNDIAVYRHPEGKDVPQASPEQLGYLDSNPTGPSKYSHKTATHFDTSADRLNPGDQIRTPTGQTVKVLRMRNHETSPGHVYMDTDQGTSVVRRKAPVSIVPFNSQQQEIPGYGTPGGNTNKLPMDPGNVGPSKSAPAGSNQAQSSDCPVCSGKGTMHRQGQSYVCNKCGYRENVGAAGPGKGFDFTDMPQRLMGTSALDGAIARRARQVLDSTEENQ